MAETSTGGVLALLNETDPHLRTCALQRLLLLVDQFWPEIAKYVSKIEALYEDERFPARNLAAAVTSKVYFHLEEYDDALKYALGAEEFFDISKNKDEYIQTLIGRCIDKYITLRIKSAEQSTNSSLPPVIIDPRLEGIVERMFSICFQDGKYKQAIGIAIDSRRLDLLKNTISRCGNVSETLDFTLHLCQEQVNNKQYRTDIMRFLVEIYKDQKQPDYLSICNILLFLKDSKSVAEVMNKLIINDNDSDQTLLAYQIAFDLNVHENLPFLLRVVKALPQKEKEEKSQDGKNDQQQPLSSQNEKNVQKKLIEIESQNSPVPMEIDSTSFKTSTSILKKSSDYDQRLDRLKKILSGDVSANLYLQFLFSHNHTDLLLLQGIKDKLEPRNSITHNATVLCHAFMQAGTTIDTFLRDELEWLKKAQHWAKFTATASLGIIHRGFRNDSMKIFGEFLPQDNTGTSGIPHQEGGALYGLGLVHANHGGEQSDYLLNILRNTTNEVILHGACLGLGLSCMGTHRLDVIEVLQNNVLYLDSAIAGEAAGLAMGLVMLASGGHPNSNMINEENDILQNMMNYASKTQHEKIIRGLMIGISLMMYGCEEQADTAVEQLIRDKDPMMRLGGVYTLGLAYVGTSSSKAVRRLLHLGVSDLSLDVRRAAVANIGHVLCNEPKQVPKVLSLLACSFDAHVRYGTAVAIGNACAGTGLKEAIDILEPLSKDRVDFVKQGAYIALSMVLIQLNAKKQPYVETFKQQLSESISQKTGTMVKFGAILATGILNAGGKNVTICMVSPSGHRCVAAIVGLTIFWQYWYWFPCIPFLSLAFTSTAMIALNKNLQMPVDFQVLSKTKPSLFAYTPPIINKKEEKKKLEKAQLSITDKARTKKQKKAEEKKTSTSSTPLSTTCTTPVKMEIDKEETPQESKKEINSISTMNTSVTSSTTTTSVTSITIEKPDEKPEVPEPDFEFLKNPSRIIRQQINYITLPTEKRYLPLKKQLYGIVMLKDNDPSKPENLILLKKLKARGVMEEDEAPVPEPFEWHDTQK